MTNLIKHLKLSTSNLSIQYKTVVASMLKVFLAAAHFLPKRVLPYPLTNTFFEGFVFTSNHCSHLAYSMALQRVALPALTEHQSNSTGLGT